VPFTSTNSASSSLCGLRSGGVATVGYIRTGPEGVVTPAHSCDQDFRVEAKGLEPSNLLTASQHLYRPAGDTQYP